MGRRTDRAGWCLLGGWFGDLTIQSQVFIFSFGMHRSESEPIYVCYDVPLSLVCG